MQLQCPNCSQALEVPDSSAGAVISCPACKGQMQVPAALQAEPAPVSPRGPAGSEETKLCPFCGETIMKVARKCKHCKEELPEGCDGESVRSRLAGKERRVAERLAAGGMPAIPWSVGGRFRVLTLVVAGFFACGLLLTIFGAAARDMEGWMVLGIILLVIFGIAILVAGINDLMTPPADARTTPEKGLQAFLRSIRLGRFKYAYACLLDGDRDETLRRRRRMEKVKVDGGQFSFATLQGFKSYWTGLAKPSGGYTRYIRISDVRQQRISGDYALVTARLKISSYPSALVLLILLNLLIMAIVIIIVTKREEVVITKLLRKVGDQWWVVNGELDSAEDRALEVAAGLATTPQA